MDDISEVLAPAHLEEAVRRQRLARSVELTAAERCGDALAALEGGAQ